MGELVSAIVTEVLFQGLHGAVHRLLKRRLEVARGILLERLSRGDAIIQDVEDIDEVAAMVFEYGTAAQRGCARHSLSLMAQVLAGAVQCRPVYADNFLRWSGLLASLSREEIIAAITQHKICSRQQQLVGDESFVSVANEEVQRVVGPAKPFANRAEFDRTVSALIRTGLVLPKSGFGTLVYETTDLMDELLKLVDIEAALQEPVR